MAAPRERARPAPAGTRRRSGSLAQVVAGEVQAPVAVGRLEDLVHEGRRRRERQDLLGHHERLVADAQRHDHLALADHEPHGRGPSWR
jgi:hypothetical protein